MLYTQCMMNRELSFSSFLPAFVWIYVLVRCPLVLDYSICRGCLRVKCSWCYSEKSCPFTFFWRFRQSQSTPTRGNCYGGYGCVFSWRVLDWSPTEVSSLSFVLWSCTISVFSLEGIKICWVVNRAGCSGLVLIDMVRSWPCCLASRLKV